MKAFKSCDVKNQTSLFFVQQKQDEVQSIQDKCKLTVTGSQRAAFHSIKNL